MDLGELKGVGPKKKELFRRLSINTVSNLYNYYPKDYEDRSRRSKLSQAREGVNYFFTLKITSKLKSYRTSKGNISYLYAGDETGKIKLLWFNDKFSPRKLNFGETYKFYFALKKKDGHLEVYNPIFCKVNEDEIGGLVARYGQTAGLSSKSINSFIIQALDYFDPREEILSKEILEAFDFSTREKNLREIHKPTGFEALKKSKSQVKVLDLLRELYFFYLVKEVDRGENDAKLSYDLKEILARLSFNLTSSQKRALGEILEDLTGPNTMNRLLIGDVGSGKTILAIIIMIIFGLNGYQAAMMVPTEVLAFQQYEKNKDLIESFHLPFALLTSSVPGKENIKENIANGKIKLVVGTHSLIQEDLSFKNLKLVITDEQHRFGVMQRQGLFEKGKRPNYLTMSATPIPRTIYLKMSKLLDISILDQAPSGRKKIQTKLVFEAMRESLDLLTEENVKKGHQVYVVTNNIDGDDPYSLMKLLSFYKEKFPNFRIGLLHGKLKATEKEKILTDFSSGKIDILLSTTVIEVGIDVKNANMMIIYNADKFGLAQLHQLRGRVGRGEIQSYCYLCCRDPEKSSKLRILEGNDNGFDIAMKDFDLRGGGRILSTIQHGKNLDQVEYLNMTKGEIEKAFEIFDYTRERNFEGVDFSYIEDYFRKADGIILN